MSWTSGAAVAYLALCTILGFTHCLCAMNIVQTSTVSSGPTPLERKEALLFLQAHLPDMDREHISPLYLARNVELALQARYATPWALAVPWDIFLNDVVPHASLDEPREEWRAMMAGRFSPLVAGASSLSEAALALNQQIWGIWGIVFKPDHTPEIMSPSQVIAAGYASCTGLSIFLVDACRAVGIPARVAGTPSWVMDRRGPNDRFNNHNWVEIWDGKGWSFMGAAEYDARGLNRTWFFPSPVKHQVPGGGLNAVYATTYRPLPDGPAFPLVWHLDYRGVHGVDVTTNYINADVQPDS